MHEGRKALAAMDGAVRRAQHAARPQRLVIAVRSGTGAGLLTPVLDAYGHGRGSVPVEVLFTQDHVAALRDGSADIGLMCSSDDFDGLDTVDLVDEARSRSCPAHTPSLPARA